MEETNWFNFPRDNAPRERRGVPRTSFNNPGSRRPYINHGRIMINNDLPQSYVCRANRHNSHGNFNQNSGPTYSHQGDHEKYSKYFKTNRFSRNVPGPYNRPQFPYQRHISYSHSNDEHERETSTTLTKELNPLETKIEKLIDSVKSQEGIAAKLVLLQAELDNPTVVLQNAVQSLTGGALNVKLNQTSQNFELNINGDKMAEGSFPNKHAAKNTLCEAVMNGLKKKCFYIMKKKNYEEVSTEDIDKAKKYVSPSSKMEGSKAHLMMLKMGWGGKGLGSNEQGVENTVAETLTQNIAKIGLGGKNVMSEIHEILEKFARSVKVTTLAFDSEFSREERAHIHVIAAKFNLKSKSEGKADNRRITISKKIGKWDLVRELLLVNCENDSYKLIIPSAFESFWINK